MHRSAWGGRGSRKGAAPFFVMWDYARSEDEVAVDFSDGMLGELRQAFTEAGVGDRFSIFRRAWQESWDGVMMDYTQETRWAVLCWRSL